MEASNQERLAFLHTCEVFITDNPDIVGELARVMTLSLLKSNQMYLERAADMEVALCIALSKKYKEADGTILAKLKKWQSKSAVNWDSIIVKLEGLVK